MRGISTLLVFLLIVMLTGCGKKSTAEDQNSSLAAMDSRESHAFLLHDTEGRELNITLKGSRLELQHMDQPLILINLFATWCPPCRGELPGLSTLQRKHAKDLLVIGILVNDEQNRTQLRQFSEKYGADFFISSSKEEKKLSEQLIKSLQLPENYPIPLSILYKEGEIYRYYEGAMPIEMMENELKQALKKQKD